MTILDEKEPTVSLKLIVVVVSVLTCAAFASLFALNSLHSSNAASQQSAAPSPTGNI
jgi:hypothetical protein